MGSGDPHSGSDTREQWFEVDIATDVIDGAGTRIGRLQPGRRYRAIDISALQVAVPGPDGSKGFVSRNAVRLLDDPLTSAAASEPAPHEPEHRSTAGASSGAEAAQPEAGPPPAPESPAERPARRWTSWAIPAAVLVVVAGAAFWIVAGPADDGGEAGEDPSDVTGGALSPSPIDVAAGQLRFDVIEAGAVDMPKLAIGGFSEQYAFGQSLAELGEGLADIVVIDRDTRLEVARLPGTGWVYELLDVGSEIWLLTQTDASVARISVFDPACLCVSREIPIENYPITFLHEHEGQVWAGNYDPELDSRVVRVIDPSTGDVATIPVRDDVDSASQLGAPVVVDDRFWIPDTEGVWIIDPDSMSVVDHVSLDGTSYLDIVETAGAVVVTDTREGVINLIDPTDLSVQTATVASPRADGQQVISTPVVDYYRLDRVWTTSLQEDGTLIGVDARTLEVINRHEFDAAVDAPQLAGGLVWVPVGNRLVAVDPDADRIAVELPGVDLDAPAGTTLATFELHAVDDALWLLPRRLRRSCLSPRTSIALRIASPNESLRAQ